MLLVEIVGLRRSLIVSPGNKSKEGLYVPLDLRAVDKVFVTARFPGAGPGGLSAVFRAACPRPRRSGLRVTDVNRSQTSRIPRRIACCKLLTGSAWVMLLA